MQKRDARLWRPASCNALKQRTSLHIIIEQCTVQFYLVCTSSCAVFWRKSGSEVHVQTRCALALSLRTIFLYEYEEVIPLRLTCVKTTVSSNAYPSLQLWVCVSKTRRIVQIESGSAFTLLEPSASVTCADTIKSSSKYKADGCYDTYESTHKLLNYFIKKRDV